jgi:hypothetical protein
MSALQPVSTGTIVNHSRVGIYTVRKNLQISFIYNYGRQELEITSILNSGLRPLYI